MQRLGGQGKRYEGGGRRQEEEGGHNLVHHPSVHLNDQGLMEVYRKKVDLFSLNHDTVGLYEDSVCNEPAHSTSKFITTLYMYVIDIYVYC